MAPVLAKTLSQARRAAAHAPLMRMPCVTQYLTPVPSCEWRKTPELSAGCRAVPELGWHELVTQLKTGAWVYVHSHNFGGGWCHMWLKRVPGGIVEKLSAGHIAFIPDVRHQAGTQCPAVNGSHILWSTALWTLLNPKRGYSHRVLRFDPVPDAGTFLAEVEAREFPELSLPNLSPTRLP